MYTYTRTQLYTYVCTYTPINGSKIYTEIDSEIYKSCMRNADMRRTVQIFGFCEIQYTNIINTLFSYGNCVAFMLEMHEIRYSSSHEVRCNVFNPTFTN